MLDSIDPKAFGLPARTVLAMLDEFTVAIIISRKSRILLAEGKKILAKAEKIKQVRPDLKVVLKASAPICSKTIKYLADNDINTI